MCNTLSASLSSETQLVHRWNQKDWRRSHVHSHPSHYYIDFIILRVMMISTLP